MTLASVITADITNSTKLAKRQYTQLIKTLETNFEGHLFEFFRGDSFQVFIRSSADSLSLLLRARTSIMKLSSGSSPVNDIRATIAIGPVNLPVKSLRSASGEAFVLSGRSFDAMEKDRRLSIVCHQTDPLPNAGLKVIAYFTDYLFQRLTVKQSAVVHELLMNKTQAEIAKKLKKSQVTVHKQAQAAGWPEIEELLNDYRKMAELIKP